MFVADFNVRGAFRSCFIVLMQGVYILPCLRWSNKLFYDQMNEYHLK